MNKNFIGCLLLALVCSVSLFTISCRRIDDATTLGDGLIPAVDNVNTFDTIITVETYLDTFTIGNTDKLLNDSLRVRKNVIHYVGKITNDPLFGSSEAITYLELKPPSYKYFFEHAKDSLTVDSAVLVMDYSETFGDTNALQTVSVYEIENIAANNFKFDSGYLIRQKPFTVSNLLGTRSFAPNILNDSVKTFLDTTKNQLRIRLNQGPGFEYLANKFIKVFDSSGAYRSDSAFRSNFKGFAVQSVGGGNALMGFNLLGNKTKLALYYKFRRNNANVDTVKFFNFTIFSGNANYVQRNYGGSQAGTALSGGTSVQDEILYLQNTPGTFARIKIPALASISNRVVHRAELIMEQVYDLSDETFFRPEMLFVDALDTALKNYKYIPFDFRLGSDGIPNYIGFGTIGRRTADGLGKPVQRWTFDLSRYVQNVLTKQVSSSELRLFTPHLIYSIYKPNQNVFGEFVEVGVNSAPARGRVRVTGGNYSSDPSRKMRLRIVYSKI